MRKKTIFFFLKKMRTHLVGPSDILAYCLMPNHFHWLLYTKGYSNKKADLEQLNLQIGTLLSSYTKAMNKRYNRKGSLFQQETKSVWIKSNVQLQTCLHYIHQNPIRSGLVTYLGKWVYSSYPDYTGQRNGTLVAKELTLDMLSLDKRSMIEASKKALDPKKIKNLF
jgi:REP element-mobilizing transposase RayT